MNRPVSTVAINPRPRISELKKIGPKTKANTSRAKMARRAYAPLDQRIISVNIVFCSLSWY
jgi:hypothetical protein